MTVVHAARMIMTVPDTASPAGKLKADDRRQQ